MTNFKWPIKVLLVILCFGFAAGVVLADVAALENQIREVIKVYIAEQYPQWADKRVVISFKPGDPNLLRLSKAGKTQKCELVTLAAPLRPAGRVAFPLRFISPEGKKEVNLITMKIEVYDLVVAAGVKKKKGETIFAEDLRVEERDIGLLSDRYFSHPKEVVGKVAAAAIPRESVLVPWMVKSMPLVARGRAVTIVFCSPHIEVKTPGEVLEDGSLNQTIKVKRQGQKKVFEARVVSSREVEVNI